MHAHTHIYIYIYICRCLHAYLHVRIKAYMTYINARTHAWMHSSFASQTASPGQARGSTTVDPLVPLTPPTPASDLSCFIFSGFFLFHPAPQQRCAQTMCGTSLWPLFGESTYFKLLKGDPLELVSRPASTMCLVLCVMGLSLLYQISASFLQAPYYEAVISIVPGG